MSGTDANPTPPQPEAEFEETLDGLIDKRFPCSDPRCLHSYSLKSARTAILAAHNRAIAQARNVTEDTSDGYHTFKELYRFRLLYNAKLFNEWAAQGKYDVHKSHAHSDGEPCFGGGWFVVTAQLPTGQISNHYEDKDWSLFRVATRSAAAEWDGHTPGDVLTRLAALEESAE